MLRERIVFWSLLLYGVGVAVSQSLMSLGGTLFVIFFFAALFESFRRVDFALRTSEKLACVLALGYVASLGLGLALQPKLPNLQQALSALPLWLVPFGALLLPRSFLSLSSLQFVTRCLVVSYVLVLGHCLYQLFVAKHAWAVAWHKSPIYLAYSLLPAVVFFGQRLRNFPRDIVLWVGAVAVFVSLLLTGSRIATLVALSYGVLAFVWPRGGSQRRGLRSWMLLSLGLVSALVGLGLVAWNIGPLQGKILELRHYQHIDSYMARMELWGHNWRLFLGSPWFGVGYLHNGVSGGDAPFWQRFNFMGPQNHFAHSIYFQAFSESGLVGSLFLFGSLLALAWARPPVWPLLLVVMVGGLTENIFSNSKPFHAFLFYMWLEIGWVWKTRESSRQPQEAVKT